MVKNHNYVPHSNFKPSKSLSIKQKLLQLSTYSPFLATSDVIIEKETQIDTEHTSDLVGMESEIQQLKKRIQELEAQLEHKGNLGLPYISRCRTQ